MSCARCGELRPKYRIVDGAAICDRCLSPKPLAPIAPSIHIFQPRLMEHLGPEPVMINSTAQLVEECDKRGLRAAAAWDKTDKNYGDKQYEVEKHGLEKPGIRG